MQFQADPTQNCSTASCDILLLVCQSNSDEDKLKHKGKLGDSLVPWLIVCIATVTISQTEGAGPSQKQKKKAARSSAAKTTKKPPALSPNWSDNEQGLD